MPNDTVVRPSTEGLQKDVAQIYPIVNEVYRQMTGSIDIKAVDTNSFIAQGKNILDTGKTELWLNTLARRIGMVIDTFRPYRNRFADLERTQLQWGAIVQKITVDVPDAVLDKSWDIGKMDGQSVDQWIINNPKVKQRFFDKESAFSYFITIQTKYLRRAFLSEAGMQALISQIFGKVTNKREFVFEELGRLCTANLIGNLNESQHIHLVTEYNNETGKSITKGQAKYDPEFLRFALAFINKISGKFEGMSVLYNKDKEERFSPRDAQRLYMLEDFYTYMDMIPEYLAYKHNSIGAKPTMKVPYWQALGKEATGEWSSASTIKVTNANNSTVELTDIVGVLFDYEAMGTFRQETDVYTTPVNARGIYYNTFWHENQFYYNMSDENAVVFFLN